MRVGDEYKEMVKQPPHGLLGEYSNENSCG